MFRQQQQGAQFPTMNTPYPNTRIQPPNASEPTFSSPLDQVKQYTAKFEDLLESLMDPIKPYVSLDFLRNVVLMRNARYLPAFGRFLIVVTFLEDALRIVTQFGDQIYYLTTYRPFLPWGVAHIFLIVNVCVCPNTI